jgi:membrane fusion protein (multidrug efflux system)
MHPRKLRTLSVLAAVACIGVAGCASPPGDSPQATAPAPGAAAVQPASVKRVLPTRGSISRTVRLPTHRIRPLQEATLNAKVAGYLKSLPVDKGEVVQAGQLLAELEVPELVADEAQYLAETEVARTSYERMSRAREKAPDLVVPQTLDDLRGRWEIARAKLQHTRTMLAYARLSAPFQGVITARFVDPGAFIPAATGSSAQASAIVTLMDASRVRVQVFVPEAEVRFIRDGLPVEVIADGLPDRRFAGTVTRSSYALDEATRTMLVEIEVPNDSGALRPGMYATVNLQVETHDGALVLPSAAVATEKSGSFVYRIVDDRVEKTPVQIGFKNAERIEVTGGLDADQAVAVSKGPALADRQPVTVARDE